MIEITDEMVTIARRHSVGLTSAIAKDLLAAGAPLIAEQEREECAKVAEGTRIGDPLTGVWIAAAIRARGETK